MTHFFIRQGRGFRRIDLGDIRYVEASKNYSKIWMGQGFVVAPVSLKDMELQLVGDEFVRVHRAYLISLKYLEAFNGSKVWVEGKELPIGDGGYNELKEAVTIVQMQGGAVEPELLEENQA